MICVRSPNPLVCKSKTKGAYDMKNGNEWLKRLKAKSHRGVTVLDRTDVPEGTCELCSTPGKELRPYGPKGKWTCFSCAMKDEAATARRYNEVVFGDRSN